MKRFLIAILLPWLGCAPAKEIPVGIDQIAVDGAGRIYAFNKSWTNKLAVWENDIWREFAVDPTKKSAQPRKLLTLRDGRVASLWHEEAQHWVLAILDGNRIVQRLPFSWTLGAWDDLEMAENSRQQIWLTAGLPEVIRCDLKSGRTIAHNLSIFYQGPEKQHWNLVFFTEDAQGGDWLWTADNADNYCSLPLPIRVRGGNLEPLKTLPGYTGRDLVGLSVRNPESLWLATRRDGLFIMDLATQTARLFPAPDKAATWGFLGIFQFGGRDRWLTLAGAGSRSSIWEIAGERWILRLQGDQVALQTWNRPTPAHANLKSGVLFAADEGFLYVPRNGDKPVLLDWRYGCPLNGASQILGLGDDRFTALARGGKPPRWIVANLQDYLVKRPQAAAEDISPWRGWAVDAKDRVFTLMENKATHLSMWDQGVWKKIPLPAGLKNDRLGYVKIDDTKHIWCFSRDPSLSVGIFDPDLEVWKTYPDYPAALLAHRDALSTFADDLSWLRPILSPDGKVAFRDENWNLHFWNGHSWQSWKLAEIAPFPKGDRISTPFFNTQDRLCVNTLKSDKTWTLDSAGHWQSGKKLPGIADKWTNIKPQYVNNPLPNGFQPASIRSPSVVTDSLGLTWVAGNGNLFRNYRSRTVPVFTDSSTHPFLSNPTISGVRRDRAGNIWLQLGTNSIRHVLLPATKTEETLPELRTDAWGAVTFAPPVGGILEWQLESDIWKSPPTGSSSLGIFPPGEHKVTMRIITDQLDVIGPASQTLTIDIAPHKQIAHLIEMLDAGPDTQRNAAVTALAQLAPSAIPVLKKHLQKNHSWWLRAALQECERQTHANENP